MNKLKVLGLTGIIISIVTLFLVKAPVTSIFSSPDIVSTKILSQAKENTPEPVLPPKPAGKTVATMKTTEHKIKVPAPTFSNPGRMKTQTIKTQVPIAKFVGPTTSDIQAWAKEVSEIRRKYEVKLDREIKKIETVKEDLFRSSLQSWATIIGGIIAGFGGLVSIIISIRKDRREQQKHDLEMSNKSESAPEKV